MCPLIGLKLHFVFRYLQGCQVHHEGNDVSYASKGGYFKFLDFAEIKEVITDKTLCMKTKKCYKRKWLVNYF